MAIRNYQPPFPDFVNDKDMMDAHLSRDTSKILPDRQPISFKVMVDAGRESKEFVGIGLLYYKKSRGRWYIFNNIGGDDTDSEVAKREGFKYAVRITDYEEFMCEGTVDSNMEQIYEIRYISQAKYQKTKNVVRALKFLGYNVVTDGKIYVFGCGSVVLDAKTVETVYELVSGLKDKQRAMLKLANSELIDNSYDEQNLFNIKLTELANLLGKKVKK